MRLPGGAAVALATPLNEAGEPDRDGLRRLVRHVLEGGVSMVCPTGSTGEGARLGARRRAEVTAAVRELVPGDIPVVSGLPAADLDAARAELAALHSAGASAALVSPPSYFPMTADEVRRFYEELIAGSPLPIVLYNIPRFTAVPIAPAVVGTLAADPTVVGIKDSSMDMENMLAILEQTAGADFTVLTGTDTLLVTSLLAGADGSITAGANMCPDLCSQIVRLVADGDLEQAWAVQRRLTDVVVTCRGGTPPPAGWKSALQTAGLCDRRLAGHASPLPEPEHAALAERLAKLGIGATASR